jgi:hypothetical protein
MTLERRSLPMNGFGRKALQAGCLAACAAVAGCTYNDVVDPCWPQRYNCMAREEVNTPFATQASNGMVLDQTVWNYHFAEGKADLNVMGKEHLDRLARRRPGPVPELYVQTAHDIKAPIDQLAAERTKLDAARMKAVTDYVAAVRADVPFKVAVHDPSPVGLNGYEADLATQAHLKAAVGSVNAAVTATNDANRAGTQPVTNVSQSNAPPGGR